MAKVKLGARIIRAVFVSVPVSSLLFITFYLMSVVVNGFAGQEVIHPVYTGLFGFVTGLSAGIGIELSKDIEES